jgi:CubicO group peptidase (beta-lactamase class C family)
MIFHLQASICLAQVLKVWENDPHGDLHAATVVQNGKTLATRIYNDGDPQRLVDVRSAGKSITSLLFGIAVDRGSIKDLNDPVVKYWPETQGTAWESVTLQDLLTMRTGLDADANRPKSPGYEDYLDAAKDPRAFTLTVPAKEKPGTRYVYNSLAAYVAGIVIEKASDQDLESFAREHLFTPLGIKRWRWLKDRGGHAKGQGNLFLTASDSTKIGQMVIQNGKYQDRQIISKKWLKASLKPRIDISEEDPYASDYGYYWYRQTYQVKGKTIELFFASGNGGNKIYLIPKEQMVITIQSTAYGQSHGHRRSEKILLAILEGL